MLQQLHAAVLIQPAGRAQKQNTLQLQHKLHQVDAVGRSSKQKLLIKGLNYAKGVIMLPRVGWAL